MERQNKINHLGFKELAASLCSNLSRSVARFRDFPTILLRFSYNFPTTIIEHVPLREALMLRNNSFIEWQEGGAMDRAHPP